MAATSVTAELSPATLHEIRTINLHTRLTTEECSLLEANAKELPCLQSLIDECKAGHTTSILASGRAYYGLEKYCRDHGMTDSDDYRFLLYQCGLTASGYLDYDATERYNGMLRDNVAGYVTDETEAGLWKYTLNMAGVWAMEFSPEWTFGNHAMEAYRYWCDNGAPKTELGYLFCYNLVCNMASSIVYIEDFDRISKFLSKTAAALWPGNTEVQRDIELICLKAQLACDYSRLILQMRHRSIVDSSADSPLEQAINRITDAVYDFYNGKTDNAIAEMNQVCHVVDSVADLSCGAAELVRTNAYSTRLRLYYQAERKAEFEAERDRIYRRYRGDDPVSVRSLMIILGDLIQMESRQLDVDSILARYRRAAASEHNDKARLAGLLSAAGKTVAIGRTEEGAGLVKQLTDSLVAADADPTFINEAKYLLATIYMSAGNPEGIGLLTEVAEYYTAQNDVEKQWDIYSTIAQYLWANTPELEEAIKWADKYAEVRPKSVWPMYRNSADYNMERIRISALPDIRAKAAATEELLRTADHHRFEEIKGLLYADIGAFYRLAGDERSIRKTRDNYEKAFSHMSQYGTLNELISFAPAFLDFLDDTGDIKRRNEITAAIIYEFDHSDHPQCLPYISLLGNELTRSVNNNDMMSAVYYLAKVFDEVQSVKDMISDDKTTQALTMGATIPHVINMFAKVVANCSRLTEEQRSEYMQAMGCDTAAIESYIRETLEIYGNEISRKDFTYCDIMLSKARWRIANKRYEEASDILDSIAANPAYSGLITDVRNFMPGLRLDIAFAREDYDEAERLLMSDNSGIIPAYITSGNINANILSNRLGSLCTIRLKQGRYAEAMSMARRRFDIMRRFIDAQYASLSENERATLSSGTASSWDINCILPLANTPDNRRLAYNAALYYRNILLESSNLQRNAIYQSGDSVTIAMYERRLALTRQIAMGHYEAGEPPQELERKRNIFEEAHQLEAEIASRCPAFGELSLSRDTDWQKVAKSLGKDDAAIEFIYYIEHDSRTERYAALILRRGADSPDFVPLLTQNELNECLSPRHTASKPQNGINRVYSYPNNGKTLYDKLWKPLEQYLAGASHIYYCPTGTLNTLAFAAIEDSTRTSLCTRYDMRMVSSTAQLTRKAGRNNRQEHIDIALVGDVDYDADTTKATARRGSWQHLDNSINEISYIDSLCTSHTSFESHLIARGNASEKAFREYSGHAPDIMHLSTHGFYLDSKEASLHPFYINKGLTNDSVPREYINPLKRSGIILADANPVWNNEARRDDKNDGVLTADEIAELNLSGTRLLVLSACETGLGEPTVTEGVSGLQRGFKLSGVESVVMSLWTVNDRASTSFMQEFYSRMLDIGEDRHTAFRNTQIKMRGIYPNKPYYWAPFVMLD